MTTVLPAYLEHDPAKLARALLDSHWMHRAMPVNPSVLARNLGIKALKGNLPQEVAGVVLVSPEVCPRIVVPAEDSLSRRRFFFAIALGCYLQPWPIRQDAGFRHVLQRLPVSAYLDHTIEGFALLFALELLIPGCVLEAALQRRDFVTLAASFSVPQEAMAFRLSLLKSSAQSIKGRR